jgi:peroxiredoxin
MPPDYKSLPPDLPVPTDDGSAAHLTGMTLPALSLPATDGSVTDLGALARGTLVVYVYPGTGVPGRALPEGWDATPGARGCTPQSCAFRDHAAELAGMGAEVRGLSAQPIDEQAELVAREHLPYPLVNDSGFLLAREIGLPTFELGDRRYYRRLTLVATAGRIEKVFYPIFPPQDNAAAVVAWLRGRG